MTLLRAWFCMHGYNIIIHLFNILRNRTRQYYNIIIMPIIVYATFRKVKHRVPNSLPTKSFRHKLWRADRRSYDILLYTA